MCDDIITIISYVNVLNYKAQNDQLEIFIGVNLTPILHVKLCARASFTCLMRCRCDL